MGGVDRPGLPGNRPVRRAQSAGSGRHRAGGGSRRVRGDEPLDASPMSPGKGPGRAAGRTMKGRVIVTLAGPVLAVTVLTGCASMFHHAATPPTSVVATPAGATRNATAAAQVQLRQACSAQTAWDRRGQPSLKA